MCGRFANALPPDVFRNNIIRRLAGPRHGERGTRARRRDEAEEGGGTRGAGRDQEQEQEQEREQEREQEQEKSSEQSAEMDEDSVKEAPGFEQYHPTHNVAPGSRMPVVRLDDFTDSTDKHEKRLLIQSMRWGLLPRATKTIPRGFEALRTINARDDSVLSGRSMWTPILRSAQRCVVFVQGFYEWEKRGVDDSVRIPHFVGMKDAGDGRRDVQGQPRALMPMAGLWERCRLEDQDEDTYSYTIITTESNKQLGFLHDRMPVILPDVEAIRVWLGLTDASADDVCRLLKPYDRGFLDVYPVPKEVGRVGNDDAGFILPVSQRKDGIAAAFGRVGKKRERHDEADANSETNAPVPVSSSSEEEQKGFKKDQNIDGDSGGGEEEEEGGNGAKAKAKAKEEEMEEEESHEERDTKRQRVPSTKWSPEPFNPPVSPPRPSGGYSTNSNASTTPSKRSGGGPSSSLKKSPAQSKGLQEAAKGTKDIRSFFSK